MAVAEQLYDALIVWKVQGSLNVTSTSLAFFQQFLPTVTAGTYASTTTTFTTLVTAVANQADGFVAIVQEFTPSTGSLSEQYSRSNGAQLSANDLTWSYASILTAVTARNGLSGDNWGAAGLVVPSSCSTSGTGSGSSGGGSGTVAVTFHVTATTVFGGERCLPLNYFSLANISPREHLHHGIR